MKRKHTNTLAALTIFMFHCCFIDAQMLQPSALKSNEAWHDAQTQLPMNTLGPFQLMVPVNLAVFYTEPGGLSTLNFKWTTSANAFSYTWFYMDVGFPGSPLIQAPAITIPAPDTVLSITSGYLDHVMDTSGVVMPGDSVLLTWGVKSKLNASDPWGRTSDNALVFWLVRSAQIQAFDLLTPMNQSRVLLGGTASNPVHFSWQRAASPAPRGVQYVVSIDTTPGFTNALFVGAADSMGLRPQLSFTIGQFDSLLAAMGVNLGDSIQLHWKVVAQLSRTSVTSTSTYSAWFVRTGLTTSTSHMTESHMSIYPNPANELVVINCQGAVMEDVRLFNINGAEVLHLKPQADVIELRVHTLPAGAYMLRVQTNGGMRHSRLVVTR